MNTRYRQSGFTLIEILVASAIILSILSFVYGTYFVISKSSRAAGDKMKLSQQALKVMNQFARQIRCSYADTVNVPARTTKRVSERKKKKPYKGPDYFSGDTNSTGEEILRLVTTNKYAMKQNPEEGLFEVIYRFDKRQGRLYLSQKRFVATTKNKDKKRIWLPIAENIQSLDLAFFDGQQWLNKWTFKEKRELPNAVKINITFRDRNGRIYGYSTVADIYCRKDVSRKIQLNELIASKNE